MYGADAFSSNRDYGRIVNRKHFDRILADRTRQKARIRRYALRGRPAHRAHHHGLRLMRKTPLWARRIFGPCAPRAHRGEYGRGVEAFVKARPKPLALYLFTEDRALQGIEIVRTVSFGGGCINDISHAPPHPTWGSAALAVLGGEAIITAKTASTSFNKAILHANAAASTCRCANSRTGLKDAASSAVCCAKSPFVASEIIRRPPGSRYAAYNSGMMHFLIHRLEAFGAYEGNAWTSRCSKA